MKKSKFAVFIILSGLGLAANADSYLVQTPLTKLGGAFLSKKPISEVQEYDLTALQAKQLSMQGYQVEKNQSIQLYQDSSSTSLSATNWAFKRIRGPEALADSSIRGHGVTVCVVDTGVNTNHVQLNGKNIQGVNLSGTDPQNFSDQMGHGTTVASLIAGDDYLGMKGVAPAANIYAVKVFNSTGGSDLNKIIQGIRACYGHAQVINMSFGGALNSQIFEDVLKEAKQRGLSLIAAAGNSSASLNQPASSSSVISVGATDKNNLRVDFSSYGSALDLMAPGDLVDAVDENGNITQVSGTSFSAAYVSGVEALRISRSASLLKAIDLKLPHEQQGQGLIDAFESTR